MSLPGIKVSRTELFRSNDIGLFIDDGREIKKIPPEMFDNGIIHIEVPISTRGRVYAEPISRLRDFVGCENAGELFFVLLPDFQIIWPSRLYALTDEPEITLITNNDIILDLKGAFPINGNDRKWRIEPGVLWVEGELKYKKITIPIAHRIYRADLRKKDEKRTSYLLSSEFRDNISLTLCGLSRERAELAITDGANSTRLGNLGLFNDAGEIYFSTSSISDALANYKKPVGQFLQIGSDMRTETLFFNIEALYEWISKSDSTTHTQWWSLLPSFLASSLKIIIHARDEVLEKISFPVDSHSIPQKLMSFFELFRRLCFLYDGSVLPDRPNSTVDQIIEECKSADSEIGAAVVWYNKAKSFITGIEIKEYSSSEKLILEYNSLGWSPPFLRWKDKIENLLNNLKNDLDAIAIIDEWRKDVEHGYGTHHSRIACQSGGRDLTHAWMVYRAGNLKGAINVTSNMLKRNIPSPAIEITAILQQMSLFRLGYFRSQPPIEIESHNKKLFLMCSELSEIIKFADWTRTEISSVPKVENLKYFIESLPLTARDSMVLNMFVFENDSYKLNCRGDWLASYCKLLIARANGMQEILNQLAKECHEAISTIPSSPDKNLITGLMERYL
jgi:hypothetical protein